MHNSLTHRSHSPSNPQEEFLLKNTQVNLETFLTVRPWAKRGSWFTHGFFFVDLSATRPKLPFGQILSHATCDVCSPEAVETLINLISDTDFRGKKLKTQRSSKIIFFHQKFSSEHIYIYIRLNRR